MPPSSQIADLCGLFEQLVADAAASRGRRGSPYGRRVPLRGVKVCTHLQDFCGQTTLTQTYYNDRDVPIEAQYVFPLDPRSAVCGFTVDIDGVRTMGVVQEKNEAKNTYRNAIARGDSAQLLEQARADIFEMKVGNLSPGQTAVINITYIADLKIEGDEVRYLLPTTVAPRYSPVEEKDPIPQSGVASLDEGLSVEIFCHMGSEVLHMRSPTHEVSASLEGKSGSCTFTHGSAALDKDFVLLIGTKEPHQPRVCIETDPKKGTSVAMITLAPRFELDDNKCELVFVVDRSGSMAGYNMNEAKKSLQLFLRSLPMDCYFNMVSFGNRHSSLWPTSQPYNEETFAKASAHIEAMTANMGGTEILTPLKSVYSSKPIQGYSRQVFVLTDGQVSNTPAVIKEVGAARMSRTFALGLGRSCSHELVEGIARAGKGTCAFSAGKDNLDEKVIQQLKDALQPAITDVKVDWGIAAAANPPPAEATSTMFGSMVEGAVGSLLGFKKVDKSHNRNMAQAPYNVPPVFSGSRFLIFAMCPADVVPPQKVTVRAQTPAGLLAVELSVGEGDAFSGHALHALAARTLIRDLEEGTSYLHASGRASSLEVKKEIIRLGTTHNLASKYTSYVAVQEKLGAQPLFDRVFYGSPIPQEVAVNPGSARLRKAVSAPRGGGGRGGRGGGGGGGDSFGFFAPAGAGARPMASRSSSGLRAKSKKKMEKKMVEKAEVIECCMDDLSDEDEDDEGDNVNALLQEVLSETMCASMEVCDALSKPQAPAPSSSLSSRMSVLCSPPAPPAFGSAPPPSAPGGGPAPAQRRRARNPPSKRDSQVSPPRENAAAPAPKDWVDELFLFQKFNGSFGLDDKLLVKLPGVTREQLQSIASTLSVSVEVVATALVLHAISSLLPKLPEATATTYALALSKAETWLRSQIKGESDRTALNGMVQKALATGPPAVAALA